MNPFRLMVASVLWAVCACAFGLDSVIVAQKGCPPVISLSSSADECERLAADELQKYLTKITCSREGEKSLIRQNKKGESKLKNVTILLGRDSRIFERFGKDFGVDVSADGFRIHAEKDIVVIYGCGRGVIYGSYKFLERFGGCRWYSLKREKVPKIQQVEVPIGIDIIENPAFTSRTEGGNGERISVEFARKNGLIYEGGTNVVGSTPQIFDSVLGRCHTFDRMIPVAKHFAQHPEWFSEIGGVRMGDVTQLCLANSEVIEKCKTFVLDRMSKGVMLGLTHYGVSANDWDNWCQCSECLTFDRAHGGPSASLMRFVNDIADTVKVQYPKAIVQTLAYGHTKLPPRGIDIGDNVEVCYCTIECDRASPIYCGRSLANRQAAYALRKWGKLCSHLTIWDYPADFSVSLHPMLKFKTIVENIRFFREVGAKGVYEMNAGGGENDIWSEIRTYIIAKALWNPDFDYKETIHEILKDYFGPASKEIEKYLQLIESSVVDARRYPLNCFESVYFRPITKTFFNDAMLIFDSAEKAVKDSEYANNVQLARLPVDFFRVLRGYARPCLISRGEMKVDENCLISEKESAKRLLLAIDSEAGLTLSVERSRNYFYQQLIRNFAKAETLPTSIHRFRFEEWWLLGDHPATQFNYVDDAMAKDARAVRFPVRSFSAVGRIDLRAVNLRKGGRYRFRVRVRMSGNGTGKVAFYAGVTDRFRDQTKCAYSASIGEVPNERYEWFDIGVFVSGDNDSLWIVPGDSSANLLVDSVELVTR